MHSHSLNYKRRLNFVIILTFKVSPRFAVGNLSNCPSLSAVNCRESMKSNFHHNCLLWPWQLMKTTVLRSLIGILKGPVGMIQKRRETGAISPTAQAAVPLKSRHCHNPNQAPLHLLETGFASTKCLPGFCCDAFVSSLGRGWTVCVGLVGAIKINKSGENPLVPRIRSATKLPARPLSGSIIYQESPPPNCSL